MTSRDAAVTLTDEQIEKGWRDTFSTSNPFCPCDLKSFTKAVRWAERTLPSASKAVAVPKRGRMSRQEKIDESREIVAARLQRIERPLDGRCAAARDGDCSHSQCPQLRDGEPVKSGRHCPLDVQEDY